MPGRARVAARSADGLVEAVELPGARFALGVQWHPESLDARHRERLFGAFVRACAAAAKPLVTDRAGGDTRRAMRVVFSALFWAFLTVTSIALFPVALVIVWAVTRPFDPPPADRCTCSPASGRRSTRGRIRPGPSP